MNCSYFSCGSEPVVREAKETPKTGTVELAWCPKHAERYGRAFQ